jgi:calcineurin-like phosphoesterase
MNRFVSTAKIYSSENDRLVVVFLMESLCIQEGFDNPFLSRSQLSDSTCNPTTIYVLDLNCLHT